MSLACRNNLYECTGCGGCLDVHSSCDICRRPMTDGEKYFRLERKKVCQNCVTTPDGSICILCRKPAKDGIHYKNIVLCRSCSGVATGYVGYI